jgi:hypothetical protein
MNPYEFYNALPEPRSTYQRYYRSIVFMLATMTNNHDDPHLLDALESLTKVDYDSLVVD